MRLLVSCRFAPYSQTPRLAARHGLPVVEPDATWHESFGPGAWLLGGSGAQIQFGHDTAPVGSVVVVAARDRWWEADVVVESDDPQVLERIRVGAPVSVGFNPLRSDDNLRSHVRQHRLARLQHIAILRRGEIPAYVGAKITSVVESRTKPTATPGADWRRSVPPGWECLLTNGYQPTEGDELLIGRTASHRFNGQRFVPLAAARLAA